MSENLPICPRCHRDYAGTQAQHDLCCDAVGPWPPETPFTTGPEALIARAIDKGVDVATMERLLAMRSQLKAEAAREAYYMALADFQKACPAIQKNKAVHDKHGKFRYRYAPLEEIVRQVGPLLTQHGFSYSLDTEQADGQLTVICRTHHTGGHSEATRISVPVSGDYMTAQQLVGSARTYASRYAFCNSFGVMTADEDDDGQAHGTPQERVEAPQSRPVAREATQPINSSPTPSAPAVGGRQQEAGAMVIGFGKFKGQRIDSINPEQLRSYRHWMKERAQENPQRNAKLAEWVRIVDAYLGPSGASEAPPEDDVNLEADLAAVERGPQRF